MTKGFGFDSIAPMQVTRTNAAAVLLMDGARVLVTGGESTSGPYSSELYDNAGNWTPSQMTTARSRHTATLLKSGQVLVVGGDNLVDPSSAELYSPSTNSWQEIFNKLNSPRIAHTATLLADGRVLVAGGSGAAGGSSLFTVEIFDPGNDPVNGSWTLVNPMKDARAFHTATLLPDGRVLVAGGTPGNNYFHYSAELFDPTTVTWSPTSAMNEARAQHTATLLNFDPDQVRDFVVLVAGGFDGDTLLDAEQYVPPPLTFTGVPTDSSGTSPDGSSWVAVGAMNRPRTFHTATLLLSDGLNRSRQVLVAGGPDPGNQIDDGMTTEIYDSATRTWTFVGKMHSIRSGHTATIITGGKILVAGGGDNSADLGTGCDASPQIVVSAPQVIDFGQVHAGSQFNNANFLPTLQNTGNATLTTTVTITGPDAALFGGGTYPLAVAPGLQGGPCVSGSTAPSDEPVEVSVQFNGYSPVPKACQATLTIGDSNATNVPAGQTWVFPMVAQIVVVPSDVAINILPPSFPGEVTVGDTQSGELFIDLAFQVSEAVSAVVRFPPPPAHGSFRWGAGDFIINSGPPGLSFAIEFTPRSAGAVTQTLELISNAQGSPHMVVLRGTGKKGIVP